MTDEISSTADQPTIQNQGRKNASAGSKSVKIGRRGSGLAFRLPKALVEKFNLKVGDSIDSEIIERALAASKAGPESKSL